MTFLELSQVTKKFPNTVAVKIFDLQVQAGEFVSFLGPSGCGKTTTLRMIAGFEYPTSGTILLEGKDMTFTAPNKRNIGMVFQSYALFPNMTVAQNISYGLKIAKMPKTMIEKRVGELLELIHMEKFGSQYPHHLSGGQQQRVALARALAIQPKLLLLDEPLSALDAKIRAELRNEIRRIQKQLNITTIYVTHDQEEALALSDRVVVMSQGVVEQVGTPDEIYNYPRTEFVARFVGQINMIPVDVVNPKEGLVKLGSQTIRASCLDYQNGRKAVLAIRPEEIQPGKANQRNHLRGTIENITYLGSIIRIQVNIEGHSITMDIFNQRQMQLPHEGEAFTVDFPESACWLMAEDTARATRQ